VAQLNDDALVPTDAAGRDHPATADAVGASDNLAEAVMGRRKPALSSVRKQTAAVHRKHTLERHSDTQRDHRCKEHHLVRPVLYARLFAAAADSPEYSHTRLEGWSRMRRQAPGEVDHNCRKPWSERPPRGNVQPKRDLTIT
jgi:hypothetical protein